MNLLGFSLSPQEQHTTTTHHHQTRFGLFNPTAQDDVTAADDRNCFDLTSSTHVVTTLNFPPFPIYQEPFNNHHHLSMVFNFIMEGGLEYNGIMECV
ncbi:hypothetical protein Ahy_A07g032384 [Arachis hypogaea]|uniref:Uncharacterized protein n=1 Tax=Arachis hypogaea TaxID=3818 RepID=A0A445C6T8_ARAHY|nr:hypothetical protein Ahy_A07g032384 [Arachis hypogaea]